MRWSLPSTIRVDVTAQLARGVMSTVDPQSTVIMPLDFLRSIIDELVAQDSLADVMGPVFAELLGMLRPFHLVTDPVTAPALSIKLLCQIHKSLAQVLTDGVANFLMPPEGVMMPAPVNPMFANMGMRMPETLQKNGPAQEQRTLLGLLFHIGLPAEAQSVKDNYENLRRRTRADVEGRTNTMRTQLVSYQAILTDTVMALLKGQGEARAKTVAWLCDSLALNAEAEKERPNPALKSTDTFLFNLGVVLLRLSGPFILDEKKKGLVRADFLSAIQANRGAYPEGLTMLGRPIEGDSSMSTEASGDYNFITQCFFLTWRALHLGFVQTFGRIYM